MNKAFKILLSVCGVAVLLIVLAWVAVYFVAGINCLAIHNTYTKAEIIESARLYHSNEAFLIKKSSFDELGKGRFPKYKIYNQDGQRLDIYECYESLPELAHVIKLLNQSVLRPIETFSNEVGKLRDVDSGSISADKIFIPRKYNMIFYYKNAMNRLQQKRLENIVNHNLGGFSDSLHVIFVNVDRVDF